MIIKEVNIETGEITERELTAEEIAQIEAIENYKPTNEEIHKLRQNAYKERSDNLYMAWKKYEVLGLTERAENAKQMWLDEVERINEEYPYND